MFGHEYFTVLNVVNKTLWCRFFFFFKLLKWVKNRTNETEENRHRIGENLAEAEALSADLQELEARLKVCVARNALFGEDGRIHRDLIAYI